MKLKIVLLALIGAAGATSSFALADSGHHGRGHADGKKDQACKKAAIFGTAAPQSFTVTVTHAGRHSPFKNGDVVTVSLGSPGADRRGQRCGLRRRVDVPGRHGATACADDQDSPDDDRDDDAHLDHR